MKRIVSIFLTLLILITLVGCGKKDEGETQPAETATQEATASSEKQTAIEGVEALELTLSHHVSENDSNNVFAEAFANAVEELSGGKMKVNIYPNGQLFGQAEALAALKQGTLDIALSDTALFANYTPKGSMFDLPYLVTSREQAIKLVKNEEILKVIKDDMVQNADIRVLSIMPLYFRSSLVKDMDVKSFDDFKGLIMRTPEAPHTIAAFKAFGANPTVIPSGEAYTAVQTGVAGGLEGHPEYVYLQKFYEVAKNYVQTEHVFTFTAYSMSQKKYDAMSDKQKEVIDAATDIALDAFLDYTKDLFETALSNLEKEGVSITKVDLEPFRQATESYRKEFLEKNDLMDAYQKIQELQ